MRKVRRNIAVVLSVILGFPMLMVIVLSVVGVCLYRSADFLQPDVNVDLSGYELVVINDSLRICDDNSLYLNKYGLWEARISGTPVERGAKYGLLVGKLLERQEDIFVEQIHQIVPSDMWVDFLHKLIIIFNRDMAVNIPQEYREEIYAMSLSCTDKYNSYNSPYGRQLNYHAAHDIGHAMQDYMLVGCSSFACWGSESESGDLIVGRNFDFYVGDDFAENKMVCFFEPSDGHRFVSVSWPGMMGVLSGMNEKGLTVTINAAKGAVPTSSAMPISLLVRHILQYASNIDEAYDIARRFRTFVSESILVGSASDNCAAIIEKTPTKMAIFKAQDSKILCTNHFQSDTFRWDSYNIENISTSDSHYRYRRLEELTDSLSPMNPLKTVAVLRDRYGVDNADIGLGNEKSLNQFIAHHSVVFDPENLKMWVSTAPWQSGEYVCYDLDTVFSSTTPAKCSFALENYNIAADSVAVNGDCCNVRRYRCMHKELAAAINGRQCVSDEFISDFINCNPNYYQVYNILGDYEVAMKNNHRAVEYWKKALSLEISKTAYRDEITAKIEKYD